jgi:conserved hypothetical protein
LSNTSTNSHDLTGVGCDTGIKQQWLYRSVLVFAATASAYAGIGIWIGFGKWRAALSAASLHDILIVVGLVTAGFLIRALRWHYYTRQLNWKVPFLPLFTSFVASFAFTATPGKAGELVKGVLLRGSYRVSLSETAGILLVERLGDVLALVVLAGSGLVLFADLRVYVLISAVATGLVAAFIIHPTMASAVLRRIFAVRKLRPLAQKLISALDAGRQLLRPLPMMTGGAMALAAWLCEAWAFYLLIGCFGIPAHYLVAFSIYGLSTLAGALSMLPGGLGSMEVVMALLLTRLAATASVAAITVIIFRLLTLWLFSLIGLVFLLGWMFHLSRNSLRQQIVDA